MSPKVHQKAKPEALFGDHEIGPNGFVLLIARGAPLRGASEVSSSVDIRRIFGRPEKDAFRWSSAFSYSSDMATRFVPRSPLGERVAANRTAILAAAARSHASNVRIFGNVARGEENGVGDVDLLVDLDLEAKPLDLVELGCDLEDVLGVKVEVGTPALLRAFLRDEVLAEAIAL